MSDSRNDLEARLQKLSPRQRELMQRIAADRAARANRIMPRSTDVEYIPASFGQERIWFMDKLIPYRTVFCVPSTVRLQGPLDPDALAWALNQIVRRHEVLRTVLVEDAGRPVQVIRPHVEVALPVEDVSSAEQPEEEARRRAFAEASQPLDLATGPLIRARLFRLGRTDHVLMVTLHHIVSDAWTLVVFYNELESLYASRLGLKAEPLPELSIQYADFALWQRQWLDGEVLEQLLTYWRNHLEGAPDVIELPTDRPRPPQRTTMGKFFPTRFEPSLIRRVRTLGKQESATLHMTLLAGFKAVLARYSRQPDVVVGVPIAGRGRSDVQPLIGFFLNWLVLRTHVGDDPSFRELLGRVREVALGGYAHQDLPFEVLVQALQPPRNLSTSPLFQVSFSVQDSPYRLPQFAGLRATPFHFKGSATHYDLMADLWVADDGAVVGNFPYNDEIFDEQTIARIVGHLTHLLAAAVEDPDCPISALPLHPSAERQRLLNLWNYTHQQPAPPRRLHELFEFQVTCSPAAPAVTFENQTITYEELNQRANRLAHFLQSLGAGPETVVAICTERSLEMVVGILAILKTGAAYLPLDPNYPSARLAFMLEDAGAMALISQQGLADRLPEQRPTVIWLDTDRQQIEAQLPTNLAVDVEPANAAYVIYTSGSTGKPKGVLVSHAHVSRLFAATHPWFDFGPDDVWTLFHSYTFDFSVWEIWGALLHGGRLVVVPYWVTRAPEVFSEFLAEQGVTVLNQTPSAFRQLQRIVVETQDIQLALRFIIFGGEALDFPGLRPWFERFGDQKPRLVNMYGITETTVHVTYRPLSWDDLNHGSVSVIGRPIPDLAAYVLDKHLEPLPIGVPGELYVGGAGVTRGYLGWPALTAERFLPNPFIDEPGSRMYRTGDLARLLPDGELAYLGRIDEQVKIRGHRIEPGEVQAAIAQQASVSEAIVLARQESSDQKRLIAYVVPAGEQRPTVTELRRALHVQLPDYMVPAAFVFLDTLPLTANGKIDYKALPPPSGQRPDLERAYVAPHTPEEKLLAEVLTEVLKVERVGTLDNFFDLGGHSLVAIQVLSRIRQLTGVELPIATIFTQPTMEDLALALSNAAASLGTSEEFNIVDTSEVISSLSDQEVDALLTRMLEGE